MFFESQVGTIGDRERRKRKSKDGKGKRLKFTEDRNERQSGKTDEKPAKRREIDCSVFLELCIVLRDRQGADEEIHGFWRPATPGVRRPLVWPLPSSLATTKGIEFSFFSSGYLDVSLPRVPSYEPMDSVHGDWALPQPGSPIRRSPDQSPFAAPRSFSQLIASFIGNQCHGIHPALLFA